MGTAPKKWGHVTPSSGPSAYFLILWYSKQARRLSAKIERGLEKSLIQIKSFRHAINALLCKIVAVTLILRQEYPYIRVQSTKFPKESGLILSKRSARILTREKHSLWFAQITFRQCFERSYHMEGSTRRLKLGSIPTIWKKPTTSPETSSKQRRKASEYKTSR